MKKLTIIAAFAVACLAARGQGTIAFSTYNFAGATNMVTGQPIPAGDEWSAQLYYGPAGSSWDQLVPCTNAPIHFALPGYILGQAYYTGVPSGAYAAVQVRIWSTILGNDWDSAFARWLSGTPDVWTTGVAKSNVGLIRTGNPNAQPPGLPAFLRGNQEGEIGIRPFSFVPIPEPSVVALGLIGALIFLCRRRDN